MAILRRDIIACGACPRLRAHCEGVARIRRRAYRHCDYWGKPVPGFGDPKGRLLIIGLAPGAHGANRTGRMFTGDGSGDFLFAALHRAGFCNQPESLSRHDGLGLIDAYITAVARCAPPDNTLRPEEITRCLPYLIREMKMMTRLRAVLVLGRVAFEGYRKALEFFGISKRDSCVSFAHGNSIIIHPGLPQLFVSYHPSRQNTQTGKLTPRMMDRVLKDIRATLAESENDRYRRKVHFA